MIRGTLKVKHHAGDPLLPLLGSCHPAWGENPALALAGGVGLHRNPSLHGEGAQPPVGEARIQQFKHWSGNCPKRPGLHTWAAPIRVQGQQPPSPWADLTLALSFFSARPWADRLWLGISLLPPTGWVSTAIPIPPARMRGFGEIQERGQGRADSGLAEIPAKARLRAESVLLCPAESQLRRRPHPHFRARDCVSSRGQRTPQKGPRSGL